MVKKANGKKEEWLQAVADLLAGSHFYGPSWQLFLEKLIISYNVL
jgi:hypothetical protein